MGAVLPFSTTRSGDWSPGERARLYELARNFADQAGVEVMFGTSDAGEPWCVVLDADSEVLVHVARVQGKFVIHSAADDFYAQADDLRGAISRVLGTRWLDERHDVVVPFAQSARHAQIVSAVLIVSAFVAHDAEAAAFDGWPAESDGDRGVRFDAGGSHAGEDAARHAWVVTIASADAIVRPNARHYAELPVDAEGEPLSGDSTAMTLASAAGRSSGEMTAQTGQTDGITSPAWSDIVVATAKPSDAPEMDGPDRAAFRAGGGSFREGGSGDDRLLLDAGTIVAGGDGSDRFVVEAPPAPTSAPPLLGIVLDFDHSRDGLVTVDGGPVQIVSTSSVSDIFAGTQFSLPVAASVAGERLGIDFDGDGSEDGYVLVGHGVADDTLLTTLRDALNGSPWPGGAHEQLLAPSPPIGLIAPSPEII
jgi:hypothetical protein